MRHFKNIDGMMGKEEKVKLYRDVMGNQNPEDEDAIVGVMCGPCGDLVADILKHHIPHVYWQPKAKHMAAQRHHVRHRREQTKDISND